MRGKDDGIIVQQNIATTCHVPGHKGSRNEIKSRIAPVPSLRGGGRGLAGIPCAAFSVSIS